MTLRYKHLDCTEVCLFGQLRILFTYWCPHQGCKRDDSILLAEQLSDKALISRITLDELETGLIAVLEERILCLMVQQRVKDRDLVSSLTNTEPMYPAPPVTITFTVVPGCNGVYRSEKTSPLLIRSRQ